MSATALRFALRYQPSTLACEFKNADGGIETLQLEFRNLNESSDANEILNLATKNLGKVISVENIDLNQLETLVLKLIEKSGLKNVGQDSKVKPNIQNNSEVINQGKTPIDKKSTSNNIKHKNSGDDDFDDLLDDLLGEDIDAPLSKSELKEARKSSTTKKSCESVDKKNRVW